jgi:hypothetical protein
MLRGWQLRESGGRMSQPIRVEGWAYTPSARVNLRLRFRSQSTYARVKSEFHNPSGGVINLGGVTHPREESGAAHTEVVPTGNVPESQRATYPKTLPWALTNADPWRGSPARGGGHPSLKTRLQHPRGPKTLPRPKRGRVPRARAGLEGGKPKPLIRLSLIQRVLIGF